MRLLAKFFRLTKGRVFLTLRALIKTDRGIGPLTSGQPSGSNPNGANSCEDPFQTGSREMGGASTRRCSTICHRIGALLGGTMRRRR